MRVVRAEEAVGKALACDVSMIDESFKGAILKHGHVLSASDIEVLKRTGHGYVYVYDEPEHSSSELHEVQAVLELGKYVSGEGVVVTEGEEGKAILKSSVNGLLKVNGEGLRKINSTGVYVVTTKRGGSAVKEGGIVGIVDLIPATIPGDYLENLKDELKDHLPVVEVKPFRRLRIGIIITGTEVFEGLVEDKALPVVEEKVREYGGLVGDVVKVPDDSDLIKEASVRLLDRNEALILTGGMSVDPTDLTPKSIAEVAEDIVMYGIPVKPNTMSMVAYARGKALIGVSSSIIYFRKWNILDVLLPWIMAGERINREYLISLGEGGLSDQFIKDRGWC